MFFSSIICPCSLMDKTAACGAVDLSSILGGGTTKNMANPMFFDIAKLPKYATIQTPIIHNRGSCMKYNKYIIIGALFYGCAVAIITYHWNATDEHPIISGIITLTLMLASIFCMHIGWAKMWNKPQAEPKEQANEASTPQHKL